MTTDRIRVLQLVNGLAVETTGGGAARFGVTLCRFLDEARFERTVAGLWDFGTAYESQRARQLSDLGIQVFIGPAWDGEKPYRSFWRSFFALKGEISRRPPAILNSHSEFGDIAALLLKIINWQLILVRTSHTGFVPEWKQRPLRQLLLSQLLFPLFFDLEIGINPEATRWLNDRWLARLLKKRAIYLPNALELDRFAGHSGERISKRMELDIPPEAFVIGSVGRLAFQKGYEYLLEAQAILANQIPDAMLVIVGDGVMRDELVELAKQLGITGRIRLLGSRNDVEQIYPCFDVLANSSRWEGLPTVLLESLAAGLPIVATDIPGNREFLIDRVNSLLVPAEDPKALAAAILELSRDPQLAEELVRNGAGTVQQYRIENVADQYARQYASLYTNRPINPG